MDEVVFAGTLARRTHKEAAALAAASGYTVSTRLTPATTLVVAGEWPGQKLRDARKKRLRVVSEDEWEREIRARTDRQLDDAEEEEDDEEEEEEEDEEEEEEEGKEDPEEAASPPPPSRVVVFAGTLSKRTYDDAARAAEAKGFRVDRRVTAATTCVVCGDYGAALKDEARKRGIRMLTEDEWERKLVRAGENGDQDGSDEVDFDPATLAINGVLPRARLDEGASVRVHSSRSFMQYFLKRFGRTYTCTCPAFRTQRRPRGARTCKHLKMWLGDDYEAARTSTTTVEATTTAKTRAPKKKSAGRAKGKARAK